MCVCVKMPDSRFLDSRATLSSSYPNACVLSKETLRTIFMMVFCLTRPGTFFCCFWPLALYYWKV